MENVGLDTLEVCDIEITSTFGKTMPIRDQVVSLSIFESVFEPLITCEVMINDAISLAHDLPLIGEELLTVKLKSTNANQVTVYNFVLHNVSDVLNDEHNKYQMYTLVGTSVESVNDAKISVQKGYFDTYDSMAKDLLKTFLATKKTVYTTPTKGSHQIIIPNLNPLRAIDMIRQRSVSNVNDYSPVVFFENADGFNYTDIVALFNRGKKRPLDVITRYFRPNNFSGTTELTGETWKNIINLQAVSKHDTLAKTHNGAYYNNLNKFDLFKKQFSEVETKLNEVVGKFDLVEEGKVNSPDMIDGMSSRGATNYMVFVDGGRQESHIDFLGPKVTYSTLLFQNIVEVDLHGDTSITVGDVLYLSFTKATGLTGDDPEQEDTKQSGYHLISKLAHHITVSGEPSIRTSCELVKGASKDIKGRL